MIFIHHHLYSYAQRWTVVAETFPFSQAEPSTAVSLLINTEYLALPTAGDQRTLGHPSDGSGTALVARRRVIRTDCFRVELDVPRAKKNSVGDGATSAAVGNRSSPRCRTFIVCARILEDWGRTLAVGCRACCCVGSFRLGVGWYWYFGFWLQA